MSQEQDQTGVGAVDAWRLERELLFQATHDPLTGLANRAALESRLASLLLDARENDATSHVLAYVDLDQFKLVNDTCGHSAGDRLLKGVAELFQRHVRENDLLARIGGDEFALVLHDAGLEDAEHRARELLRDLNRFRFTWKRVHFDVGASIGLTAITGTSGAPDEVFGQADIACYAAKDGGRNRVESYGSRLSEQRHREMRWPARLHRALETGRLHLAAQPIVPLDGPPQTARFELLLRLKGEDDSWIYPGEFIQAAERFNMAPMLDRWVASWVLRELLYDRHDAADYLLSINLSGASLSDDDFLDWIITELESAGPVASSLAIEITETAAVRNLDNVAEFIRRARYAGCRVALDDFGRGLSSFAYLDTLEIDSIKIDGQFVKSLRAGGVGRHVVAAVAQLGQAMGVSLVAEHVEDADTVRALQALGVHFGQGYYFAPPAILSPYATLADLPHAAVPPPLLPSVAREPSLKAV